MPNNISRPKLFKNGLLKSVNIGRVDVNEIFRHEGKFFKKHSLHLYYSLLRQGNGKYEFVEINPSNYFTMVAVKVKNNDSPDFSEVY